MRRKGMFCLALVLALSLVMPTVGLSAPVNTKRPLKVDDFVNLSTGGFGDAQNSYAWSMANFGGDLYVGTGRLTDTFSPMWELMWGGITPGERPPQLPDVPFPPFLQDFVDRSALPAPMIMDEAKYADWNSKAHAQIWRLHDGTWSKVWQAADVPAALQSQAHAFKYTTSEITGLRSMVQYKDKNGTNALYAASGGFNFSAPGFVTQLLRSTDGTTWKRLKTPDAMGRESRATAVFNGKMYVGTGGAGSKPGGSLWASDEPSATGSWKKVLDFNDLDANNTVVISVTNYNGRVYAGTQNGQGFQVWRSTTSNPQSSADWVKIVSDGAGDRYNVWAGTMKVFRDRLYVGSISLPVLSESNQPKGFDIIRIDQSDRSQLLVGNVYPTLPVTPDETRTPLSGWPSGFGNPMNFYCWQLEEYGGRLYAGTFDSGVFLRYLEDANELWDLDIPPALIALSQSPLAKMSYGADLWETRSGTDWSPVSLNGLGDNENYGFRTLLAWGDSMYVGTSNPWTGCQIWKAKSY